MNSTTLLLLLACSAIVTACDRDRMSEKGLHLPEGDPIAGERTFVNIQCTQCHTVVGHPLATESPADPVYVELGGDVANVMTYGELVTAIINPSHELAPGYLEDVISEDGESNMYVYNRYMTMQQLIDIVAYLQPLYVDVVPDFYFITHP